LVKGVESLLELTIKIPSFPALLRERMERTLAKGDAFVLPVSSRTKVIVPSYEEFENYIFDETYSIHIQVFVYFI